MTPPPLHFLHIGKTGGSAVKGALKYAFKAAGAEARFVAPGHGYRLRDVPEGEAYVFSVRDPVTRFVSAFYSRKRKGAPRTNIDWKPTEVLAFGAFEHAADLAEALFSPGARGMQALGAMRGIGHVSQSQVEWFPDPHAVLHGDRQPLAILRTEALEADFGVLLARLGMAGAVSLPEDAYGRNAHDYAGVPPLSSRGAANIRRWYAADMAFVAEASAFAERALAAS